MIFSRRRLLSVASATLAVSVAANAEITTDLAVTCDAAATPAVRAAGLAYRSKTGIRVRVFPTAPGLVLPQIERQIQNDIIFTQTSTLDQAAAAGLVPPGSHAGPWRNRLVMAMAASGPEGSVAVPDVSPASDIDGVAILQRMGIKPAQILGVIDTGAVAWTLGNGDARQGLLHQTASPFGSRCKPIRWKLCSAVSRAPALSTFYLWRRSSCSLLFMSHW